MINKKGGITQILGLLIVVVLTSAGILFLVKEGIITVRASGSSTETIPTNVLNTNFLPMGRLGELNLKKFQFCELADEKFQCHNEKDTFFSGDKVYVVFLVESSTLDNEIMLQRNYLLRNPRKEVILEIEEKNTQRLELKSNRNIEKVAFADYITTEKDYAAGIYTLEVIIENPLLGKKITAKKEFKVQ
ncbi:hypothetical protein J4437_03695 [Candidatus Woesearchaeota archaeon]|nr:hypothetical protein [Candidatus Woesearchaeota archaeon]